MSPPLPLLHQTWLSTFILSLPITPEIFKALVPGLVLKALLATLPMVLGFLAVVRGAKSQAEVQWEMTERYFPFQVPPAFPLPLCDVALDALLCCCLVY